jgi:hypothetical protein
MAGGIDPDEVSVILHMKGFPRARVKLSAHIAAFGRRDAVSPEWKPLT